MLCCLAAYPFLTCIGYLQHLLNQTENVIFGLLYAVYIVNSLCKHYTAKRILIFAVLCV